MLTAKEVSNIKREIQVFHEFEAAIGDNLEKIRADNPTLRNGKLYRDNIGGYKLKKDRQRNLESQRNALTDKLADHEDEAWVARQSAER